MELQIRKTYKIYKKSIMKKTLLFVIILSALMTDVNGQKSLESNEAIIEDSRVYIRLSGKEIYYFSKSTEEDGDASMRNPQKLILKNGNHCNIFMKWLNPLRYKIVWEDSVYLDSRDVAIGKFIKLLSSQFTSLKTDKDTSILEGEGAILKRSNHVSEPSEKNDQEKSRDKLEKDINNLYNAIRKHNKSNKINERYKELVYENDPNRAANCAGKIIMGIDLGDDYSDIIQLKNTVKKTVIDEKTSFINTRELIIIENYLAEIEAQIEREKLLQEKLIGFAKIVQQSLGRESIGDKTKGYYFLRNIDFENGRVFQTSFAIYEYSYDEKTNEFNKKDKISSSQILFQKYDCIGVFVSTGIFYSNTSIKKYGIANGSDGRFTVAEDNIRKNSPVTAVFLNLSYDIGSSYLLPLIQLGMDPTKKPPFLLLGVGFAIPSAHFALSGGALWTWDPILNKFAVGQSVPSDLELEKDIKYDFDVSPKGWYLGLQYNW